MSLPEVVWHWRIVRRLPTYRIAPAPRHDALEGRPPHQAHGADDEGPDDELVLVAVALEAQRRDVVLLGVFAEVDALAQAEGLGALGARLGLGPRRVRPRQDSVAGRVGCGLRAEDEGPRGQGGGAVVLGAQRDDGAVLEAGAFAERRRGWRVGVSSCVLESGGRGGD